MSAAAGAALFAEDARLKCIVPGYAPREGQADMAQSVAGVIESAATLVTEAGTGTGKTLAYLLPALASGRKIIVSTSTRYLQEQLFNHDLPLAQRILGYSVDASLLKG